MRSRPRWTGSSRSGWRPGDGRVDRPWTTLAVESSPWCAAADSRLPARCSPASGATFDGAQFLVGPSGGVVGLSTAILAGSPFADLLVSGAMLLVVPGVAWLVLSASSAAGGGRRPEPSARRWSCGPWCRAGSPAPATGCTHCWASCWRSRRQSGRSSGWGSGWFPGGDWWNRSRCSELIVGGIGSAPFPHTLDPQDMVLVQ